MPRFLADECFPGPMVRALRQAGFEVARSSELLPGAEDRNVLGLAVRERTHSFDRGRRFRRFGGAIPNRNAGLSPRCVDADGKSLQELSCGRGLAKPSILPSFFPPPGSTAPWIDGCPLRHATTSGGDQHKRDVLGTWLWSILAGHHRYSHITALRRHPPQ